MSMTEINTVAKDLMDVRAMIAELEAEAEALTDKLKSAMVDQGTEVLQGDGWKATWKNVNSRRFDSKSFKAGQLSELQQLKVAKRETWLSDGISSIDCLE